MDGARTPTWAGQIQSHVLPLWRRGRGEGKGSTAGGSHGWCLEPVVWPWRCPDPATLTGGAGETGPPLHWYQQDLSRVDLGRVHAEPRPTRDTIAINRIYFVQLLPTYTWPRGLPKWVLGWEGWPSAWRLKSVDRHTQGGGLTAAVPGCPLHGSGGAKARPVTLGQQRPVSLECPEYGMAGAKLRSQVGPPPSHKGVTCLSHGGSGQGIGRSVVELEGPGGAIGIASSLPLSPPGAPGTLISRVGWWEVPGRTVPHSRAGVWNHSRQ